MKIFLIGMSGIGMQGLAYLLKKEGNEVSGYDDGKHLSTLEKFGIPYKEEFDLDTDLIIYSSAIKPDHKLIQKAKDEKKRTLNRIDGVELLKLNERILVSGAHGKTTTSAMLAYLFKKKFYMIGGIINGESFPANNEKSEYTILETDESDGSFVKWKAKYKILLNFDFEHMDFYQTEENIKKYYQQYIKETPEDGICVINADSDILNEFVKELAKDSKDFSTSLVNNKKNVVTYGKKDADYIYHDIEFNENGTRFKINETEIELPLFGEHNVSNFTAIFALLDKLKISQKSEVDYKSIRNFPGVKKRMQEIRNENGNKMYLDYGHHPVEVENTLAAFFTHKNKRAQVVLEPHKYTRLAYTWDQWPKALKGHRVFIYTIYGATEAQIPGISEEDFVKYLRKNGIDASVINQIEEVPLEADTICFSAGKLGDILSK